MSLGRMMDEHRKQEMKAIYSFIDGATVDEVASIISEIRVCHDNILVFNEKHKSLDKVVSVSINSDYIQLNLEK
jgi:hypothetical protein